MNRKEIDKTISALILIAFAVIWVLYWIISAVEGAPDGLIIAVSVIRDVVQCLMYLVVLYNALGSTGSLILKIVYIVIAVFLIFCVIATYIPALSGILGKIHAIL